MNSSCIPPKKIRHSTRNKTQISPTSKRQQGRANHHHQTARGFRYRESATIPIKGSLVTQLARDNETPQVLNRLGLRNSKNNPLGIVILVVKFGVTKFHCKHQPRFRQIQTRNIRITGTRLPLSYIIRQFPSIQVSTRWIAESQIGFISIRIRHTDAKHIDLLVLSLTPAANDLRSLDLTAIHLLDIRVLKEPKQDIIYTITLGESTEGKDGQKEDLEETFHRAVFSYSSGPYFVPSGTSTALDWSSVGTGQTIFIALLPRRSYQNPRPPGTRTSVMYSVTRLEPSTLLCV